MLLVLYVFMKLVERFVKFNESLNSISLIFSPSDISCSSFLMKFSRLLIGEEENSISVLIKLDGELYTHQVVFL